MTQKANLIGGKELAEIRNSNPGLANLLHRMIKATNNGFLTLGVSPLGESETPPSIGGINVKAAGGIAHITIADTSITSKPREWFIEHDTDPNFTAPHVVHVVASRGAFISLPSLNDDGQPQMWHFRAYSQNPGSQPSAPVYFGGLSPTPVDVGGTSQFTPLPSTGSGTASPAGGQGGWGRGKVQTRPPQGPKRSVS